MGSVSEVDSATFQREVLQSGSPVLVKFTGEG